MGDIDTLRFITCGSVDDGKSTLIGRLLYESKSIFDDQMRAVEVDSRQYGTQGEQADLALLVDGLQAEREQGITIDVAYRFFATPNRRFIVADTPGHEQYTRNMATGASTADIAVILIDARKGVLTQTRRHSRIVALMGIRQVVLAINKMDLVGFSPSVFREIVSSFQAFANDLQFSSIQAIPLSALQGDNVFVPSARTPWYSGPTLMSRLNSMAPASQGGAHPFRMPVQWVNRPNLDFRGFTGRVAQGAIQKGDSVCVLPSGLISRVKGIVVWQDEQERAGEGESITLTLEDELDISRGDVLVAQDSQPAVADAFQAHLLWMSEQSLVAGRPYLVKLHAKELNGSVSTIKHKEDVNTGSHLAARTLELNEIGVVNLTLSQPVVFEPYKVNRPLGAFILIDKMTQATVGAGMIDFALRRATNIHWQSLEVDRTARAQLMHQRPRCVWFTGLSGSGKSTIANLLEKQLHAERRHTFILDGDNIRHGLNQDLGFTVTDRVENIRRIAHVAKLMTDAGLIVLVSFISPFRAERQLARDLFAEGDFLEVFVDASLAVCEHRDTKGLYAKSRRGELPNFTGIDSAYEAPLRPELHLSSDKESPEACMRRILEKLR